MVTGLSGMGKSRLSFAYAKKNARTYHVVWVFDASKNMENQMIDFANKLYALAHKGRMGTFSKKEDASHYVKTLLRTCAFSWLIVLDAAPSMAAVKDQIPETFNGKDKHVIVTSLSGQEATGALRLNALTDAEAHHFLRHYLKDATDAQIADLATLLGNHPLALLQAATYITSTPNMDIAAYNAFFTQNKKAYWDAESKVLGDQPQLYTTIRLSLEQLKNQNPQEYKTLLALCLLDTHSLDGGLIQSFYTQNHQDDMAGFGKILDVSLITKADKNLYSIHDYVRDVALATADKESLKEAGHTAAKTLLGLLPPKIEDCIEAFEKNPALYHHAKHFFDQEAYVSKEDALALGIRLFYFSERRNHDFDFAVPYSARMKALFESQTQTDPLTAGIFYANYGCTVLTGGSVDASLAEFEKAYAHLKKADADEARTHLVSLLVDDLGFFHHWKGDLARAQKELDEAKDLMGEGQDPALRVSVNELEAVLEQDRGNFDKALVVLDQNAPYFEKDAGLMQASWPFTASLRSCSLVKLGKYQEAHDLSQKAIKMAVVHAGGNEHDDQVGRLCVYLSQAQSGLGHYKEAEASARKAIAIIDKCYGAGVIRRQGVAYIALGDALMGQKRHEKAIEAYLKAVDIFEKISSHKVFDDMSEAYAKVVMAADILGDKAHRRLYAKKHQEVFGVNHPRYAQIYAILRARGESAVFES